jgi:hypothetical protein
MFLRGSFIFNELKSRFVRESFVLCDLQKSKGMALSAAIPLFSGYQGLSRALYLGVAVRLGGGAGLLLAGDITS